MAQAQGWSPEGELPVLHKTWGFSCYKNYVWSGRPLPNHASRLCDRVINGIVWHPCYLITYIYTCSLLKESTCRGHTGQTSAVTSFMIDDILNPSRSSRTISSSSGATEGTCCSEEVTRRSDSPVSMFSEETERDGSPDGSDSDTERSSSQGMHSAT